MQEDQEQDDLCTDPDSVLGRVRDIRRKWAVQEDEALAYRLQDEEIAQHYNSNRTRNAIVREDAPRAREAQRQEELQALEERLKHLSVLQRQAEEDGRLAKILAARDEAAKAKKLHSPSHTKSPEKVKSGSNSPNSPLLPTPELVHHVTAEVTTHALQRTKSPLLGAAAAAVVVRHAEEPGPSRACYKNPAIGASFNPEEDEEDLRKLQEERDAAVAKALQDELDRAERDKQLALEAQDRELAKMLHEKERARYRRAKEKARMKAEAMAGGSPATDSGDTLEGSEGAIRAASRNSATSERSTRSTDVLPPRIPEKQKSPTSDEIGFRANPKPLPPHPPLDFESIAPPPPIRLGHRRSPLPVDPVPPYMPIHGYNRNSPKRNK